MLWVHVGIGATAATGGTPSALQALVGLRVVRGRFQAEAFGLVPLSVGDVTGKEGSAAVSATMIGAHLGYALSDEGSAFQVAGGAGGAVLLLTMKGVATSPYSAHDESLSTGAFFLHAGSRYRIAEWLGVRLSTMLGFCAPRPVVAFAGRDVAAWGPVFGTVVASLEFGSPVPRERP